MGRAPVPATHQLLQGVGMLSVGAAASCRVENSADHGAEPCICSSGPEQVLGYRPKPMAIAPESYVRPAVNEAAVKGDRGPRVMTCRESASEFAVARNSAVRKPAPL